MLLAKATPGVRGRPPRVKGVPCPISDALRLSPAPFCLLLPLRKQDPCPAFLLSPASSFLDFSSCVSGSELCPVASGPSLQTPPRALGGWSATPVSRALPSGGDPPPRPGGAVAERGAQCGPQSRRRPGSPAGQLPRILGALSTWCLHCSGMNEPPHSSGLPDRARRWLRPSRRERRGRPWELLPSLRRASGVGPGVKVTACDREWTGRPGLHGLAGRRLWPGPQKTLATPVRASRRAAPGRSSRTRSLWLSGGEWQSGPQAAAPMVFAGHRAG